MNIGVVYLSNLGNSWNMSEGVLAALKRMGHTVTPCLTTHVDAELTSDHICTPEWNSMDFVLVLEAEYIPRRVYNCLTTKIALWFTETDDREDLKYDYRGLMEQTPYNFVVAKQDADKFGCTWLPHGVDTEMFRPLPRIPKTIDIGYYGQIYGRRIETWKMIQEAGINVKLIERVRVPRPETIEILVRDINRCRMILAMPAYVHSFTTRPTEVMACGVPVVVPHLADFARCNESQWKYTSPCYYFENSVDSLHMAIESARRQDYHLILKEVHDHHRLEVRLQEIIEAVNHG